MRKLKHYTCFAWINETGIEEVLPKTGIPNEERPKISIAFITVSQQKR